MPLSAKRTRLGVNVLCLLQRRAPSGCPLIFALADAVVLRGRACRAPAPARAWGFRRSPPPGGKPSAPPAAHTAPIPGAGFFPIKHNTGKFKTCKANKKPFRQNRPKNSAVRNEAGKFCPVFGVSKINPNLLYAPIVHYKNKTKSRSCYE